jgi:hypothetical protein
MIMGLERKWVNRVAIESDHRNDRDEKQANGGVPETMMLIRLLTYNLSQATS